MHVALADLSALTFADIPLTYPDLVSWYPPMALETKAEYDQAVEVAKKLSLYALNPEQEKYLDTLGVLIQAYEAHHPFDWPQRSGIDMVKSLLADHDMSVADFSRLIGVHRSVGTRILKGERNLTLAHMKALCERFKVGPDLFLT
jgi:HTH-type transcriptional regulator/antitoxin HigA